MTISAVQRRVALSAPVSSGWLRRSAWARSGPWRRGRSRALPATAATGSNAAGADLIGERRQAQRHALPRVTLGLPVRLLSLGYGAGLRGGEVVRLKVKHIDSAQKIIHVQQSNGRKDRLVMLSPETLALLRAWWKVRPKRDDDGVPVRERWLFAGRNEGARLSVHQLNNIFHKAADAAGIRNLVNLHSLRHSTWSAPTPSLTIAAKVSSNSSGPRGHFRPFARRARRVANLLYDTDI